LGKFPINIIDPEAVVKRFLKIWEKNPKIARNHLFGHNAHLMDKAVTP